MRTTVQQIPSGLTIPIPENLAQQAKIQTVMPLDISLEKGRLIIQLNLAGKKNLREPERFSQASFSGKTEGNAERTQQVNKPPSAIAPVMAKQRSGKEGVIGLAVVPLSLSSTSWCRG